MNYTYGPTFNYAYSTNIEHIEFNINYKAAANVKHIVIEVTHVHTTSS